MDEDLKPAMTRGEQVLYVAKMSLWTHWGLILTSVMSVGVALALLFLSVPMGHWVALGCLMCGVGCAVVVYVHHVANELVLTNKWVMVKTGFIHQNTTEVNLADIQSLQIDQPLMGRICGFGTLTFAGTGLVHARVAGVAEPLAFRKVFLEALEGVRQQVGSPLRSLRGR